MTRIHFLRWGKQVNKSDLGCLASACSLHFTSDVVQMNVCMHTLHCKIKLTSGPLCHELDQNCSPNYTLNQFTYIQLKKAPVTSISYKLGKRELRSHPKRKEKDGKKKKRKGNESLIRTWMFIAFLFASS